MQGISVWAGFPKMLAHTTLHHRKHTRRRASHLLFASIAMFCCRSAALKNATSPGGACSMDAFIPFQVTNPPPHVDDAHPLPGSGFSIEGETSHQASLHKRPTSSLQIQRCLQGIDEYGSDDYATDHSALSDAVPLGEFVDAAPR